MLKIDNKQYNPAGVMSQARIGAKRVYVWSDISDAKLKLIGIVFADKQFRNYFNKPYLHEVMLTRDSFAFSATRLAVGLDTAYNCNLYYNRHNQAAVDYLDIAWSFKGFKAWYDIIGFDARRRQFPFDDHAGNWGYYKSRAIFFDGVYRLYTDDYNKVKEQQLKIAIEILYKECINYLYDNGIKVVIG